MADEAVTKGTSTAEETVAKGGSRVHGGQDQGHGQGRVCDGLATLRWRMVKAVTQ